MKQIYFLRRVDGTGPIKIGCSKCPEARRKQIGSDTKAAMCILATAPGDYQDERSLHLKFLDSRVTPEWANSRPYPIGGEKEWFDATPELLALVERVAASGKLIFKLEERRDLIFAKRYLNGETLQQIANDYGLTRERVRQVLRKAGIASLGLRPEHCQKAHELTLAERRAAKLYADGAQPKEIMSRTGLTPHQLRASVRRLGGAMKEPGWWNREIAAPITAKVCELYSAGEKPTRIAKLLGLSHATGVYRHLRRGGVSARGYGGRGSLEARSAEIIREYRGGLTQGQVAARFGASVQGVRNLLHRHGAELSPEEHERRRITAVIEANKRRSRKAAA